MIQTGMAASPMRNLRLVVAYDGTDFCGWQRQPNAPSVQGCLEEALGDIMGGRVQIFGSGRTDAGAHAANQVANFKTASSIPCPNLQKALNNLLSETVRVKEVREVTDTFHARYQARSKTYRYRILTAPVASPFIARFAHHYPYPLDRARMAEAARLVEGEHDFASFAGSAVGEEEEDGSKGARSAVRTIFSSRILWRPRPAMVVYEVTGNGFLHHMVRNIVGTLLEVGRGKIQARQILEILSARDRRRAGPTAPAKGLCLMKVEYGQEEPGD